MMYLPLSRRRSRRGAVAAQVALCLTVLLGIAAVVLDGGLMLAERQHAQETADAAALAAAVDLYNHYGLISADSPDGGSGAATTADNVASANGYSSPAPTVNIPPTSGNFNNTLGFVEVIVQHDQPRYFSAIFGSGTLPIRARAVAGTVLGAGGVSILMLSPSANPALTISGSASITVPGEVVVDSSATGGNGAVRSSGSAGLVAPAIDVVGGVSNGSSAVPPNNDLNSGNAVLQTNNASLSMTDPLSSIAAPSTTGMTVFGSSPGPYTPTGGTSSTSPITLSPGVYTGGLNLQNKYVLLQSGTYYLTGPLTLGGSGVLTSGTQLGTYNSGTKTATLPPDNTRTNVMIYIDPGANNKAVDISGWVVQLLPPASGTYQGISIFENRTSTATIAMSNMKTTTDIEGTIYAAKSAMTLSGGSQIIVGSSFVSDTMTLSGSSSFTIPPPKILTPGLSKHVISLVE